MGMLMSFILLSATPAFAQPSPQATDAVRANCRGDFLSYCQGVPRGGREALACLARNMDRLNPGCRAAVSAVERSLGAR